MGDRRGRGSHGLGIPVARADETNSTTDPNVKSVVKDSGAVRSKDSDKKDSDKKDSEDQSGESAETDPEDSPEQDYQPDFDDTDSAADQNVKSVEADLVERSKPRPSLLDLDIAHSTLAPAYDFKDTIEETLRLKIGVDYATLAQYSTFTESGDDMGYSQVFRVLGTWDPFDLPKSDSGVLVWKMETRNSLGGNPAPRDMSFDTGTALGTANFKELRYWG